jgi:hypothetical protein
MNLEATGQPIASNTAARPLRLLTVIQGRASMSRGNGTEAQGDVVPAQPAVERITVALIRKAGEDLRHLQERTNLSKTDIVNRAISLYEFFDNQQRHGQDVVLRNPDTGELQSIFFL